MKPDARQRAARTLAAALLLAAGCVTPREFGEDFPAFDADPEAGRFDPDAPTYRWDDLREPQVRFDHHRTWLLDVPDGARASFRRRVAPEGPTRGELRLEAVRPADRLLLRPDPPIVILEPFDTFEMAMEGRAAGNEAPDPDRTGVLRLWMEDASGERRAVPLGRIPVGPLLRQRHLGRSFLRDAGFPYVLVGIEVVGHYTAPMAVFLDDMTFYPQCGAPLPCRFTQEERPLPRRTERMTEHFRAGSGPPHVVPGHGDSSGELQREADGSYVFRAAIGRGVAEYRIRGDAPHEGVDMMWNGMSAGRWPGLRLTLDDGTVSGPPVALFQADPSSVVMEFDGGYRVRFFLREAALHLRLTGGRRVREIDVLPMPWPFQPVAIPWLSDAMPAVAAVFVAGGSAGPLAVAVGFDPDVTRSSGLAARTDASGLALSLLYHPAMDGRRAWLDEEIRLVVSDTLREVLPDPPRFGAETRRAIDGPAFHAWLEPEDAASENGRRLRAFGMTGGITSGAMPDELHRALAQDALRPGEAGWTRDALLRDVDGHWVESSSPGAYRIKRGAVATPTVTSPADREGPWVLPAGLTAHPPWAFVDYDTRINAPAVFRSGVECLIGTFRSGAEQAGAWLVGEGDFAWWYAAGLDAWKTGHDQGRRLFRGPLLPHASRWRLRDRGMGIGLGPEEAWRDPGDVGPPKARELDRYLAIHLAYGLMLRLPSPDLGPARLSRLYYPARALHEALADAPVEQMAWEHRGQWTPAAAVIASGDLKALSRLYLRFSGGLELWINGTDDADWSVRVGDADWTLPPGGWVANDGSIVGFVAREGAHVAAYARGSDFVYRDGDGSERIFGGLGAPGPVVAFKHTETPGSIEIIDIGGTGGIRIEPGRFGLPESVHVEGEAIGGDEPLADPVVEADGRVLTLRGDPRPARYLLVPDVDSD